ncbi:poly(U)-specific 3'-to-5' RNA exonuclease [Podospora pseudopauciseta]|uniref:U6 snRNA phosphodiesterase n=1 Tax=Podospora pseudopauciseta TaxID=2093780 RepID=A0ABR0HW73_9PEZI|nr:poly(U)-specific 3'-to-5' RNA exonuclease [Podospora pseudopauciseta]
MPPLVDYGSDSNSDADTANPAPPPAKKPRLGAPGTGTATALSSDPSPDLPPLPASFHDLYASTARTFDDPSLHQGRTRQTPHIPGNWPSHVYIEWHPPPEFKRMLSGLIYSVRSQIRKIDPEVEITSFLESDLGVPLPLHISLSRPLNLSTFQKDLFLSDLQKMLAGDQPFEIRLGRVEWHFTSESGRAFLVLRVACPSRNNELVYLLSKINELANIYGQPQLYSWASAAEGKDVADAFHFSIAWCLGKPSDHLERITKEVFAKPEIRTVIGMGKLTIHSIKVKIGNVVTNIPLRKENEERRERKHSALLGL